MTTRTGLTVWGIAIACWCAASAWADRVVLKSGQTVEGVILEETGSVVTVEDRNGARLPYYRGEIERVERGPIAPPAAATEAAAPLATPAPTAASAPAGVSADHAAARDWTTAIVTYRLEGDDQGTETVYFDGEQVSVERQLTVEHGRPKVSAEREIDTGAQRLVIVRRPDQLLAVQRLDTGGWPVFHDYLEDWSAREVTPTSEPCEPDVCRVYEVNKQDASGAEYLDRRVFHRGLLVEWDHRSALLGLPKHRRVTATKVQYDVRIPAAAFQEPPPAQQRTEQLPGLEPLQAMVDNAQGWVNQALQRALTELRGDATYGPVVEESTRPDGTVDILIFRRLLRERRLRLPDV